ncbi:MAG: glucose-1-phosphate adenylyltransferase [Candidatus Omnitrophota bacterium]
MEMHEILKNKVLTFIMAGGRGERLFPLTRDRAKPAVPFGGIYRIIDFTLSNCINSGLRKIEVLTQYKSISLDRHLKAAWNIFSHELGEYINIIPAQQRVGEDWYRGTADSIYQNIYTIKQEKPEYVFVLAGDHLYKMDYSQMIASHISKKADVTIGIIKAEKEKSPQFGVLEIDENFKVQGLEEKPLNPRVIPEDPSKIYASMGIYIFNVKVLLDFLEEDAANKESCHDFGKNAIPLMLNRGCNIYAYNFVEKNGEPKYWRDIGNLDAYYEANMDLVNVEPVFNLYDKSWPIRTYHEQVPPAKTVFSMFEGDNPRAGLLLDSVISNGCIVSGGKVTRSILSPNVRINSFSSVTDSIIMENVNIGRYAKIRRAIIDKEVQIPAGAEIGYDLEEDRKKFVVTQNGIVVVAKATVI